MHVCVGGGGVGECMGSNIKIITPSGMFLLCRAGQRAWLLPSVCPNRGGAWLIPGQYNCKVVSPTMPCRGGGGGHDFK